MDDDRGDDRRSPLLYHAMIERLTSVERSVAHATTVAQTALTEGRAHMASCVTLGVQTIRHQEDAAKQREKIEAKIDALRTWVVATMLAVAGTAIVSLTGVIGYLLTHYALK